MTANGSERLPALRHTTGGRGGRRTLLYDAGGDVGAVRAALERVAPAARSLRVDAMPALDAALRARDWDAVLVVGHLDRAALEAIVARSRAADPELPVLLAAPPLGEREAPLRGLASTFGVADPAAPAAFDALLRAALDDGRDDGRGVGARAPGAAGGGSVRAVARLLADLDLAATRGDVLAAIAGALGESLGLACVETWLLSDDGSLATPGPRHGAGPAHGADAGATPQAALVREVVARRRAIALHGLASDDGLSRREGPELTAPFTAVHAAPLLVGRRGVGAVLAFGDAERPLDDDHRALVDLAAARAAAVLARIEDERARSAQRDLAAALLEHVGEGIVACDADGRVTFVNAAMDAMLAGSLGVGSSAEAWAAAGDLLEEDGITPVAAERVPLVRALRGESFDDGPFVLDAPSGRRRIVRMTGQPLRDEDGRVRGAIVAARDVTERMAAEAATAEATERALRSFALRLDDLAGLARDVGEAEDLDAVWRALMAFTHHALGAEGLAVVRRLPDGTLVPLAHMRTPTEGEAAASASSSTLPLRALERAVTDHAVVMESEAADGATAAVPLVLGGEVMGAFAVRAAPGGAFDGSAAAALTMAGNLAAIALDHDDLVEGERRARASAETSARRFRQIFDAGPAAVCIVSRRDGRIVDLNRAMEGLAGFGRDELIGARLSDLGVTLPREDATADSHEATVRRKDGTTRACLVSTEATDLAGERADLVLIVDISERLAQQERLRNLARFRESLMAFIGETLDVGFDGPFYQRLLQSAVEVTPNAQGGSLVVRDPAGDAYGFVAAVGYDLEGLRSISLLDHEIARADDDGRAVVSRALPTRDDPSERGAALRQYGRLDEIRSTLTVPIHLEGRRVASLSLDNFERTDAFDDEALQLAEAFASQVATLIKRRALEHELEHMAYHDNLTGLPNRVLFRDRLQQAVSRAVRGGRRGAAIFVDLDNLKVTNDAMGHGVGDALLQAVARRLQATVRAEDTVARIGGDEFTMVLADVSDTSGAAVVADKILAALSEPFSLAGHEVHVSASLGITLFPDDGTDADALIQHGDAAMYQAKAQGKARYRFFTREMNHQLLERASLEAQLRKALERDEFELHFQPRFSLVDGRVTSVEALARWHHPERGWIAPATFIPIAEEAGLIGAVGARLLDMACRQAKAWQVAGTPAVVAFNVSVKQLQERELVRSVGAALAREGLEPRWLELELTESAIMRNVDDSVLKLTQLRALGVSIAIDDFGTAYSSLNYLKRLPATTLKIDRSFVRDVGMRGDGASQDAAIVRAVVALATALDLTAIAEGVETPAQLAFLRDVGCHQAQGFLLAAPVPAKLLGDVLRAGGISLPG